LPYSKIGGCLYFDYEDILKVMDENKQLHGTTTKTRNFTVWVNRYRDSGHVLIFFNQAGFPETEAQRFLKYHESNGWTGLKGNAIANWKTKANEWIWDLKRLNPHLRFK
jgi:hypothetical protein